MSRTAAQAEVHCVRRRWRRLASSGPEPRSLTPHQVTVGLTDTCWHYLSSAQRFYRLARRLFGFASPRLASPRLAAPHHSAWSRCCSSLNRPDHVGPSPNHSKLEPPVALPTPHSPLPTPHSQSHSYSALCASSLCQTSWTQSFATGATRGSKAIRPSAHTATTTRSASTTAHATRAWREVARATRMQASKRGWHRGNGCGCRKGLPPGAPASVPAGSRTPRSHLLLQTRGEMPPFSPDPPAICVSRLL